MNTPPSDHILTWNGSGGGVLSENIVFKISTPPVLPFPFDTLYYETPTGNAFKLMGGVRYGAHLLHLSELCCPRRTSHNTTYNRSGS